MLFVTSVYRWYMHRSNEMFQKGSAKCHLRIWIRNTVIFCNIMSWYVYFISTVLKFLSTSHFISSGYDYAVTVTQIWELAFAHCDKIPQKMYVEEEECWLIVVEVSLTLLGWTEVKQSTQDRGGCVLSWQPGSGGGVRWGGGGDWEEEWLETGYLVTDFLHSCPTSYRLHPFPTISSGLNPSVH